MKLYYWACLNCSSNSPGSPAAAECEGWRAAAGCRSRTEQACAAGPRRRTGWGAPAAHSHLSLLTHCTLQQRHRSRDTAPWTVRKTWKMCWNENLHVLITFLFLFCSGQFLLYLGEEDGGQPRYHAMADQSPQQRLLGPFTPETPLKVCGVLTETCELGTWCRVVEQKKLWTAKMCWGHSFVSLQ